MRTVTKIFLWLNLLLAFSSVLAYFAPSVNPHDFSMLSFFGLSFPVLILFHLAFILFWIMIKMKYSLISMVTLAVGWVFIKGFIAFNVGTVAVDKQNFSIVTYNISNALQAYDRVKSVKLQKSENMASFLDRFKDEDVVCLQEVGPYAYELLKKQFDKWNFHKLNRGTMIMTKHQILDSGEISFGTVTNSCLWADIIINFDTVRVYSVHLQSNKISRDADKMIEEGQIDNKETWLEARGILSKYHDFHLIRAKQAELVKKHTLKSPYPIIICGDLNDTPLSYTYSHLSKNLNDVFYQRGKGVGTTYSGKIPFLRIDYILTDKCIEPVKFHTIKEQYSDHYPVAALVNFKCK